MMMMQTTQPPALHPSPTLPKPTRYAKRPAEPEPFLEASDPGASTSPAVQLRALKNALLAADIDGGTALHLVDAILKLQRSRSAR